MANTDNQQNKQAQVQGQQAPAVKDETPKQTKPAGAVPKVEEALTAQEFAAPKAKRELVAMRKGDAVLHVHPATVKAHHKAGWRHA